MSGFPEEFQAVMDWADTPALRAKTRTGQAILAVRMVMEVPKKAIVALPKQGATLLALYQRCL